VCIKKNPKNPKTQDVILSPNMPIICHTTDKKIGILNSQKFIIKTVGEKYITISDENDDIIITTGLFHKYFYLGFCITIHASQGATFKEKYTIYDWNFTHFCKKAKYVAMSRGTNTSNIQISI
jgi:hypothetical protein